jgi:hypothetical protein
MMATQTGSRDERDRRDQPPAPGGDPDQPPTDLPAPRTGQDRDPGGMNDKDGFGHIGNKDVPSSKGTPKPHQIF